MADGISEEGWLSWSDKRTQCVVWISFAVYALTVIRTAWVADDAFITFRTVDNFVNGFGLTWNISERVQAYSNPLWMFLMSALYFVTREVFFTSLLLSIAVSLVAVGVLIRRLSSSHTAALVGLFLLINSKAFVDYSTSGLENPLTHLILALFLAIYLRARSGEARLLFLSLIAALGAINRMDSILLFLPCLALVAWSIRNTRALGAVVIGFIPFVLWELFSLLYYGFLFPNTAYAKLNTGIAVAEILRQGVYYLFDSATVDPLTPLTLAMGIVLPLVKKDVQRSPIAAGVLLYVAYVVWIGGDFMSGRFLSAPFFAPVALIILDNPFRGRMLAAASAVIFVLGLASHSHPLLSSYSSPEPHSANGISDERPASYETAGLLRALAAEPGIEFPNHDWAIGARQTRPASNQYGAAVWGNIGFTGFFVGPNIHVIDPRALSDPLLARLPAFEDPNWGIGHFRRVIPEGYFEGPAVRGKRDRGPESGSLLRQTAPHHSRRPARSRADYCDMGYAHREVRPPRRLEKVPTSLPARPLHL